MSTSYRIKALSELLSTTPRTLRFYEQRGLLAPRRENRRRIYSEADRRLLSLLLAARQVGLGVPELAGLDTLATLAEASDGPAALASLRNFRDKIDIKIMIIRSIYDILDEIERHTISELLAVPHDQLDLDI